MTLGHVREVAREAGIPTRLVRSAAGAMDPRARMNLRESQLPPGTNHNRLIDGPTRIIIDRFVDGEVAEADFPVMVDEIRYVMRNAGQVGQLGRSFTWLMTRASSGMRRDLEVVVTVRGGTTRITLHEGLGQLIGAVWGPIGGGMGGGGLGMVTALFGFGFPGVLPFAIPAWLVLTFATARYTYFRISGRRERELSLLADRLEQLARELAVTPPPQLRDK